MGVGRAQGQEPLTCDFLGNFVSQNHRIVWVGGKFKDHLVPTLCRGQGHFLLDHVAQIIIIKLLSIVSPKRTALIKIEVVRLSYLHCISVNTKKA